MAYSNYWELNTFQKASLKPEELETLRKIELMNHGVADPVMPSQEEYPSFHSFADGEAESVTCIKIGYYNYMVEGIAEEELSKLRFTAVNQSTIGNDKVHTVSEKEYAEVYKVLIYKNYSKLLQDYKAKYGDIQSQQARYNRYKEELAKAEKATAAMYSDHAIARSDVTNYEKIESTLAEYEELAKDKEAALTFLFKRFDQEEMHTFNNLRKEKGLEPLENPENLPRLVDAWEES